MSWASRRRTAYGLGVLFFLILVIGGPIFYKVVTRPATCGDGIRNQGETSIDKGGPCPTLDERTLSPAALLWSRGFRVRDGLYNAVAYLQNPNQLAGVRSVRYRFGLYDAQNVLVAETTGETVIMPSAVTPVFAGSIQTGNRIVTHTYFEFAETPVWEKLANPAEAIQLSDIMLSDMETAPRITAIATNSSVKDVRDLVFVATVFDPAGNAFASSQTALPGILGGEKQQIIFTWPDPFRVTVGRIDIIPVTAPAVSR